MQTGMQLVQEQRQQLVMTPELRQALSVLQYSITELNDYLMEQVTENPVLDWEEEFPKKQVVEGFSSPWRRARRHHDEQQDLWWENVSVHKTLHEQMEEQLRFAPLDADEKEIALFLLGHLDERGYLNVSVDEACNRFKTDESDVLRVLRVLQQFEPAGICARDLQECLLLQIERFHDAPPLLSQMVREHLPALAEGRWKQVAMALGCDQQHLQQMVDWLRKCDPNPGLQLIHDPGKYVVPDVIVEEREGKYIISINDGFHGKLRIHPEYERFRNGGAQEQPRQVQRYLAERFQAADWLFKNIESRRQTLLRITQVALERQEAFFTHGIAFLRPMTLADVAGVLDLHESTVSRAIRNKYLQTPRGLIPFKMLFSSGLTTISGEGASREGVKEQIKQLVEKENKARPLSDQQLANALKKTGVRISRRTVAKYRGELAIPSSTRRKRPS